MKKWTLLVLAAVMVLTLAACGGSKNSGYSIAISQILEHPSLDATRQGFLDALKDAGIVEGENLTVDVNIAQNDQTNNLSIAQKIAGNKHDLAVAIATPSAVAVAQYVKDTPVLFAAVTDPLQDKLVESLESPGGNVTGAADTNPVAVQDLMAFIGEHFPDVKTVGAVINRGETNAVIMVDNAKSKLAEYGIDVIEAAVTNTSEVKQAAESLVGRADAIFIALDNTVVSGVASIIQVANENDIPFFSSDRDSVEAGAFATVGFKYYDHGYQAGQMAVEILKNGKKPSELPVSFPDKLDLILNLNAAAEQGITVTDSMKAAVKDPATNIIE